ncbi:hypothetical protein Poli38472_002818 [Pythium oligandrum]|uniref:Uncharacterized protein n=1 Tax=Pythium oligandrum TaxID=41045 RepID=A0A8K1FFK1_PYTOL|nr:hypothetical protein Poli38472_002818 [Pythium oligandrum]|eukprot:TMW56893.1 hypothetical protein Poli38472_002818 [Pythium oligandrum]
MEFNWADPRKNSRLDSLMMAKAEASRKKRLSSIKSTVSNQLHPAAESKLKKTKKSQEGGARPSSRLHRRELDEGNNNSSHGSSRGSNNHQLSRDSFYNEFLPVAAKPTSVFDQFDVHAAADGLFHPASTIQAFAEHDAKYPSQDNNSANSSSRSHGDSSRVRLSSRVSERLPPLSGKNRSVLGSGSSESHLVTTGVTSSELQASQSDINLHAPRRVGIVPSTADRNAIDFFDDDEEEYEPQEAPVASSSSITSQQVLGHHSKLGTASSRPSEVPALNLTQKFEALKLLIQTNREHKTAAGPETEHEESIHRKEPEKKKAHTVEEARSSGGAKQSALRDTKIQVAETKAHKNALNSKMTKVSKEKQELRHRSGMSLADLKEEHRAALQMLKELGGPVDPELIVSDDTKQRKKVSHAMKSTQQSKSSTKGDKTDVRPPSGGSVVDKLRSSISSGRKRTPPSQPNDEEGHLAHVSMLHGQGLVTAALEAARDALERVSPAIVEEDESWKQYADDADPAVDSDDDNDDPSADMYSDEEFE